MRSSSASAPVPPAGAAIDPDTGVFTWTPDEADGPGTFTLDVVVTDDTGNSDSEPVTIQVAEVNQPPVLDPIGNRTVYSGAMATFTATAIDADLPEQILDFTLGTGAPQDAVIDPLTGVFTWATPDVEQDTTYTFSVVVSDPEGAWDVEPVSITVLAPTGQGVVVTSVADNRDIDGVITLREALEAANSNSPVGDAPAGSAETPDLIIFNLSDGYPATIRLTQGYLSITDDVLIQGPGSDMLTVDAEGGSRILYLAADTEATLSGITLANGNATSGGGIYNAGDLTLLGVTLSGNAALGNGGAIYNNGGEVTVRDSASPGTRPDSAAGSTIIGVSSPSWPLSSPAMRPGETAERCISKTE